MQTWMLRELFLYYRDKLTRAEKYPCTPDWIRETILNRVDELLTLSEADFRKKARDFSLNAARFVHDQCDSECEEILSDIPQENGWSVIDEMDLNHVQPEYDLWLANAMENGDLLEFTPDDPDYLIKQVVRFNEEIDSLITQHGPKKIATAVYYIYGGIGSVRR